MPTSVSKTPLFTGNGPISFSQLSSTFRNGVQENIKFSDYKRNIDREDSDPIVPDATENEDISDSDSNLKISTYRGSIKTYGLTQTGTDSTFDLGSSTIWNGNLNRNIIKSAKIEGICHATSTANYGLKLESETYNLDVDISGQIYGEGGTPGGPDSPAATAGNVLVSTNTTVYTRIPVYRYVNPTTGDHFSTTSQGSPAPSGYVSEGILCYVFSQQAPGTTGIYDNDDGDFSNAGRPYSGIMGYAYLSNQANTTRIYALTNGFDTMWSTQTSEGSYTLLRTEFYAPTADVSVTSSSTTFIPGVPSTPTTPVSGSSDGGGALYVRNLTTRSAKSSIINISLNPTARVWAGGGSGKPGNPGTSGPLLTCNSTNYFTTSNPFNTENGRTLSDAMPGQSCRNARSGATWYSANANSTRSRCRGGGARAGSAGYQCSPTWTVYCQETTTFYTQGNGGTAGTGGPGRGYSNFNASLSGNSGNFGNTNSCGGSSSTGFSGNAGTSGGDWGEDSSVGSGGPAVTGNPSYYRLRGDTTTNLKGKIRNI